LRWQNSCLKELCVIVSTRNSSRLAFAVLTIAHSASVEPASAGNIVRFDASYAEPAPPADSPRACWRWSKGAGDWTWACRIGAYKRAYPVDPLEPPAPVRYDYPDSGTSLAGSTLSLAQQPGGRDPWFRSHAD
jgi:hypothetical protein